MKHARMHACMSESTHMEGLVAIEALHSRAELPLALRGVLPIVRLAACHLRKSSACRLLSPRGLLLCHLLAAKSYWSPETGHVRTACSWRFCDQGRMHAT